MCFCTNGCGFPISLALQDINLTRFSLPRRRSWGSSAWEARQGLDSRPFRPDTSYGVIQWLCVHVWGLYQSEGLFSWCSCHLSSLYRGEELWGQPKTQSATQPFLVSSRNAPPAKNGCVADYEQPFCMKVLFLLSLHLRSFDDFIGDNYCIVAHLE